MSVSTPTTEVLFSEVTAAHRADARAGLAAIRAAALFLKPSSDAQVKGAEKGDTPPIVQ
jgi:hypothetical protein